MASPPDKTSQRPSQISNVFLDGLKVAANYLEEQINSIEQLLSSSQVVDHLVIELIKLENVLRRGLRASRRAGMNKYEPCKKILRRSRRLRHQIKRLRWKGTGGSLVGALLACEELRRQLFGDLFCQEFEELSLSIRDGGGEKREDVGERNEERNGKGTYE